MRHARLWLAWWSASVIVAYATAYAVALAYPGRGVEIALAAFAFGVAWVSVTPAVLRTIGRRLR